MIPMGQVEKMTLQAFTDATESRQPITEPYMFLVNPATYNENFSVQYNEDQAPGTSGTQLKYQSQPPGSCEFELLIDGTGVVKEASALSISLIGSVSPLDVDAEVRKLKAATVDINSDTHRNPYLIVSWGNRTPFKGTLASLDLNYKLFKPDGTPLRVIAKVRLRAWVSDEERTHEEGLESPDITHERIYKASDKLALMGYRIYNDSRYYMDIAKANGLNSFRKVQVGRKLKFPPIK
jgi:hypothetical protein